LAFVHSENRKAVDYLKKNSIEDIYYQTIAQNGKRQMQPDVHASAYLSTRPGLAAIYPSVPAGGKEPGGRACTRSLRQ